MKILLVGANEDAKQQIIDSLMSYDDDMQFGRKFTNHQDYKGLCDEYIYYLDTQTINLSYKNNALIYVITNEDISVGLTSDEFINNNLFSLSMEEFNSIPEYILINEKDILVVWVDMSNTSILNINKEMKETTYFENTVESLKLPMLYFYNENPIHISNEIHMYVCTDDEDVRKNIIRNNE